MIKMNEENYIANIIMKYDEVMMLQEKRGISYGEIAYIQSLSKKELQELEKELENEIAKSVSENE